MIGSNLLLYNNDKKLAAFIKAKIIIPENPNLSKILSKIQEKRRNRNKEIQQS